MSGRQPSTADSPMPEGAQLLVELGFASPAFGAADNAVAVAFPMLRGYVVVKGRATWFRAVTADGQPVFDGSVGDGQGDYDLVVDDADMEIDTLVRIEGFSYRTRLS